MTEEKMKELYDRCTPEKKRAWRTATLFHHMKARSQAENDAEKDKRLEGCVLIYAETGLSEFI
jgi:hypothetical protein